MPTLRRAIESDDLRPRLEKDHVLRDAPLALTFRADARNGGLRWTVRNRGRAPFVGVLRLVVRTADRFRNPWVLLPGFLYGENRRAGQGGRLYPRWDPACPAPRALTSAWWDFAMDRIAVPLVFLHEDGRALAAFFEPHARVTGRGVAPDDAEQQVGLGFGPGYLRMSFPACEEPFTFTSVPDQPATIRRVTLPPGGTVTGACEIATHEGDRHVYQRALERAWKRLGRQHRRAPEPDVAGVVRDLVHGVVKWHYHEERNYFIYSRPYHPVTEQIANGRGITIEWHEMMTGFVGGFLLCDALLAAGPEEAEARRVALRVADRICRDGVSPSGLFWAGYVPSTVDTPNGRFPNPLARGDAEWGSGWLARRERVHSRTLADACFRLACIIERAGRDEPRAAAWRAALKRNLDVILRLQLPDGRYGQQYDAIEGRIAVADGCGGLLWIPAFLAAARIGLGGRAYGGRLRDSARRAGAAYARAVEDEYIWGAPEDNDSPTSEDGMNAVMAYHDLYGHDRDPRWLALARRAADWMLSFRKAYNVSLPPDSLMGRYGMRSRGGDYASSSNNHLHVFGAICIQHLCDLARWTGCAYYRERARDNWAFVCQYLCRCDGMHNGFRGAMAEQFGWAEWASWGETWKPPAAHVGKGSFTPFTAVWCNAALLLGAEAVRREFKR